MLPVAILTGGLATRLRPMTYTIPKALVEVAGKPFILRQLAYLHEQGVDHVVLCIGYLGDMIKAVVGNGGGLGLRVSYSDDGQTLLGTGGALRKATRFLGDQFFVLYGDAFLPVNLTSVEACFENCGHQAMITVFKNKNQWDLSNVLFSNCRVIEYNKRTPNAAMNHIDYGLGVVSTNLLNQHPIDKPFDLGDLYHNLSIRGQLAGLEVFERFYEIGSTNGLKDANDYFSKREKL